jgi:trk system potassium uptake protein TrkA
MRAVILGCGRVGSTLAAELDREGHTVGIIDLRNEAFQRFLPADFGGDVVLGNGIDEDALQRAGLDQADYFAALTDDDNTNIMASQVAKLVFQVPRVVCRIYDRERNETFRALGLETVAPVEIASAKIRQLVEAGPRRRAPKTDKTEAGG